VTLDVSLHAWLSHAVGSQPVRVTAVGGGCISAAARAELADGRTVFVKRAPSHAAPDLFEQEALSLERLRAAAALRVPAVIACSAEFLALEWLEPVGMVASVELGRGLARLHAVAGAVHGWDADNYIGPLPQQNAAATSWAGFWRSRRLLPQIERAAPLLDSRLRTDLDLLLTGLDERLAGGETEPASLLHGDLWSGNVHPTADGPALIDPASYYGHREVDLAMAALFGGFGDAFEHAYRAEWPLQPGAGVRRAIYQLYYLLVHVNLFGAGYVAATARALRTALS
jgi:protein-ribulosamine 3-kinase